VSLFAPHISGVLVLPQPYEPRVPQVRILSPLHELELTGGACITLLLSAAEQRPTVTSVDNLASGQASLSPGVLATVFGSNLELQQPSTVPVSVTVNDQSAAVLSKSPQQLTVQASALAKNDPFGLG
jgi:hypothetical protein